MVRILHPRSTVRWLMVLVAIVALGFGAWAAWRRQVVLQEISRRYQTAAEIHSGLLKNFQEELDPWEKMIDNKKKDPQRYPDCTLQQLEYMARSVRGRRDAVLRKVKEFEDAASHPWLHVDSESDKLDR